MKKQIKLMLEMESDDEFDLHDNWIKEDLEREITCCCNHYDIVGFETKEV